MKKNREAIKQKKLAKRKRKDAARERKLRLTATGRVSEHAVIAD